MPTQLSPGVIYNEYDLTTIVPAVSTSTSAMAGIFGWGPVNVVTLVDSEEPSLVKKFGQPTNLNPETWFTAANFLGYGNSLLLVRSANTSGATPFATFNALAANSSSPSNIYTVNNGNTNALINGMYVAQTSNTNIINSGNNIVISVVNSTAISVVNGNTVSNSNITMYFANPGTSYNALALAAPNAIVANLVNQIVENETDYYANTSNYFDTNVLYVAKYPGGLGNSLKVSVCDSPAAYSSVLNVSGFANATAISNASANVTNGVAYTGSFSVNIGSNNASLVITAGGNTSISNAAATIISNAIGLGDNILVGNSSINYQQLQVASISNVSTNSTSSSVNFNFTVPYRLHTNFVSNTTISRYWQYYNAVGVAPSQSATVRKGGNTAAIDQMHIVVVDNGGAFTGTPGTVLETYKNVSRASDCTNEDGTNNYYVNIINQNSEYIWWGNDRPGALSGNAYTIASSNNVQPASIVFTLGSDGYSETSAPLSVVAKGYDFFNSTETSTVDLVMQGYPTGSPGQTWQLGNYLIDNISGQRRDCVTFISPDKSLVLNNYGNEAIAIRDWTNQLHPSSYAFVDSGYKYQYDQYNNVYRWIPLNGDMAGLCARTDETNNSWWSPAGFNRGRIKNVVKLAYNPKLAERDLLYVAGVNSVVTFPGQGTLLYGDKTFLNAPSAFDRINVRRLFITLERAISLSAKYSLFEFNDAFTQAQFVNMVNPYLRSVQGLRGITDFKVICDGTNNTPQVVDSNKFAGDIYIKPARSINFIQLSFVAVGTGVQFSTVVRQFT